MKARVRYFGGKANPSRIHVDLVNDAGDMVKVPDVEKATGLEFPVEFVTRKDPETGSTVTALSQLTTWQPVIKTAYQDLKGDAAEIDLDAP